MSTSHLDMVAISRVLAGFATICACLATSHAISAPRTPTNPAEVLERLPIRPGDANARELAGLRADVTRAAMQTTADAGPATLLAQRYFELAVARGDPRYVGYADALVAQFPNSKSPEVLAVRGQLLQYRHEFGPALANFASALNADPQFAVAHAWRGAIFLVQADYSSAKLECDALQSLQRETLYGGCVGLLRAYTGQLEAAAGALQTALNQTTNAGNRLWLLTRLGEVSAWRSKPEKAERYYREALALGIDDGYLLAAWSDFLLDQSRPAEVVKWLANWEASDGLLLRMAMAEKILKLPAAKAHAQALGDRFAAARMRGDTTHRAEEARFELQLLGNPTASLAVAAANYQVQREPRDARALLEAAIAAGNIAAAQPVRNWLQTSGFEDAHLRRLGERSAQASNPVTSDTVKSISPIDSKPVPKS
ncbi:MAG: hypothetical protein ABI583_12050 [Betaproteobacteria bacterium]